MVVALPCLVNRMYSLTSSVSRKPRVVRMVSAMSRELATNRVTAPSSTPSPREPLRTAEAPEVRPGPTKCANTPAPTSKMAPK